MDQQNPVVQLLIRSIIVESIKLNDNMQKDYFEKNCEI